MSDYDAHHSRLSGMAMVLKAAEAADLPAPRSAHSQTGDIQVHDRAAFDAWVEWLDTDNRRSVYRLGSTQHIATAERFEVPVHVVWIEKHPTSGGQLHTMTDPYRGSVPVQRGGGL